MRRKKTPPSPKCNDEKPDLQVGDTVRYYKSGWRGGTLVKVGYKNGKIEVNSYTKKWYVELPLGEIEFWGRK